MPSASVTVGTPSLAVSPASGTQNVSETVTLTGVNTVWTQEVAAGLFAEAGGAGASVGTPTVNSDTSATALLTNGSAGGNLTITDTSTSAAAIFTVQPVYAVATNESAAATDTTDVLTIFGQRASGTAGADGMLLRWHPPLEPDDLTEALRVLRGTKPKPLPDFRPALTKAFAEGRREWIKHNNRIALHLLGIEDEAPPP